MLLDLTPAATVKGSLFEAPDDLSSKARMGVLDAINRKFSKDTLVCGTAGLKARVGHAPWIYVQSLLDDLGRASGREMSMSHAKCI